MKLKNRRILILLLLLLIVAAAVVYVAVIRPLTAPDPEEPTKLDLLDGEVRINDKLTNFYIFEPLERSAIEEIRVENEWGGYRVYRDAADEFQLDGAYGMQFDPETFSGLIVAAGTPIALTRVVDDADDAALAEYGLDVCSGVSSWKNRSGRSSGRSPYTSSVDT